MHSVNSVPKHHTDNKRMVEGGVSSSKKRVAYNDYGFLDLILSWSIDDILNEELYRDKVEKIGLTFDSIDHYLGSYKVPLLEETRAQLYSNLELINQASIASVIGLELARPFEEKSVDEMAKPFKNKLYDLKIDGWEKRFTQHGEPYKMLPGDVLLLTDCKPESVKDLQRFGRFWSFVGVVKTKEEENDFDNNMSVYCKVKASKDLDPYQLRLRLRNKSLFLVFLTNVNSNGRIWNGLHMPGNLKLVKQILYTSDEVKESCGCFSLAAALRDDSSYIKLSLELNESQNTAISACLSDLCHHNSTVKLIWGPPGTGKTKTLGTLLFLLMKMKYRILVCAPTNVAIKEVASRVLSIVKDSICNKSTQPLCSTGDMLLFGNNEKLDVGSDIDDMFLDNRIEQLRKCFSRFNGWRSCYNSMIDLLQHCVSDYRIYNENENENEVKKKKYIEKTKAKSFLEFLRERFVARALTLKNCIDILCTHVPMFLILEGNYRGLVRLNETLESFQEMLFQENLPSEEMETVFSAMDKGEENYCWSYKKSLALELFKKRNELLRGLESVKDLLDSLDLMKSTESESIREFCFKSSSIIFCTTSSSYRLHQVSMKPLNLLVIDEAAQLKECESVIPLLLPGMSHAILVGDEQQLPSMVRSNVSSVAGFGRSLFERLSLLGHSKHLLNMQHRMHPEISLFPNSYFYSNKILDAPNVERTNYEKRYLSGPMFGPYSFINVVGGREEFDDDGRSYKNVAEAAVVMTILKNLHKAWVASKEKVSIGIVSPYAGQVLLIQEKIRRKYDSLEGFNVNVKSIDGFQGGEQDIIILSTVRTNCRTSLQFIASPQRTNVALTRAKHCLWILGNEMALAKNENVWKTLVLNSKNRKSFFNADQDKEMEKAILDSKKELDQSLDLLDSNSILFRNAMWKVDFTDKFLKSFTKLLHTQQSKNSVLNVLERLASGWRPRGPSVELACENSSQILKQFKVGRCYIICSIEIMKLSKYVQILKFWDILPLEDIPKVVKRLDSVFCRYTDEYITCCKEKGSYGKTDFPLSWPISTNIQKFKRTGIENAMNEEDLEVSQDNAKNSMIEESTLLMKYCSVSQNYMLTEHEANEVDLPIEVTKEQSNVILFRKSTFVLGRSGTGKTTVLTTKLIQNEKLHHIAVETAYASNCFASQYEDIAAETERPVLRQLFVTLSPGLCQEVQHHVTCLKRSLCMESVVAESISINENIGNASIQFKNIPDSFNDLPSNFYPLVITFRKFLLMLDGTMGNSYLERFSDLKGVKEVNYKKFDSLYWPHFNSQITKKLDSYLVFTEIMSHIKGCTKVAESGSLSREDYCTLSESRVSSLSMKTREMIYDIFLNYEKMKLFKGEYDVADIVFDLHDRLKMKEYRGDQMNFVFIDEVQDLTMSQIALYKHICRNVEDGFVFCGDTAQTIGKGIDFRFQDVRNLFYTKFVLESKSWCKEKRKEKGQISDIFMLSQNFRAHDEVLKLSQSVIELLFHFFPHSVDMLKVETSLKHGELPIVVKSRNGENPILTIFGGSGWNGKHNGSFGSDQVILVRDDSCKREIMNIVGKKALVLTILECKGLEFKDVLLYNFFGSSTLKRRWGIIYEYMKEKNMLDTRARINNNSQSFVDSKHNVLCSELKQLYVALTRTRNRLWIFEDVEEFCKPMFDYWEKKKLVQFQILDGSLVETMKEESSGEEWRLRGDKMYHQDNFEMATVCFERAAESRGRNL